MHISQYFKTARYLKIHEIQQDYKFKEVLFEFSHYAITKDYHKTPIMGVICGICELFANFLTIK